MSSVSEIQLDDDLAPPPPALKKRTTKRGLSKTLSLSSEPADDASEAKVWHVTSVYSSCVQRSSLASFSSLSRKPLFSKQNQASTETGPLAAPLPQKSDVLPIIPTALELPDGNVFIGDDLNSDEGENSVVCTEDVSVIRSPSPPVPPPPPAPARRRAKRVSKGIKNAFKMLNSMKGELHRNMAALASSPDVIICDDVDSPVRRDRQVVRVRHMDDIHRFSMAKTDMYYHLQRQMAGVLNVPADQVGLYLNDRRLPASETPQDTKLHLADIIVCHVLVLSHEGQGDADAVDADSMRIQMQCPNSRQNSQQVIKKYLPFQAMFEKYAATRGKPVEKFKFHFDGELLTADMLPADVDLEENDTIDVVELK